MDRSVVKVVTSGGAAYNLDLGFVPHFVEVFNQTKWDETSQNTYTYWCSNMAAASYKGFATQANLTDGLKAITGTSNGFTAYDTGAYAARQKVITGATQANPCVITSTGHGLSTGDVVTINSIVGMTELNGGRYTVTYVGANSFSLDDTDSTGFTAYSSGGIATVVSDTWNDSGFKGITLGTVPMANSSDVLTVRASYFDNYGLVSAQIQWGG